MAARGAPVIVGGEGAEEFAFAGLANVKGSILKVSDVLYVTAPDNVWAVDAHTGRELWRYFWKTRGGTHIGNRGAAIWNNYLFFETPDNYLVSLDARTGKERWHVEIASFNEQYFSTAGAGHRRQPRARRHRQRPRHARVPAVVRSGDRQAAVEDLHRADESRRSRDSTPGRASMRRGTAARRPGFPASSIRKRGSTSSAPATRRPATPARAAPGDNLFACSLVAFNVDTGKIVWHYQTSPHDTHDWDSAQTPVLIDGDHRRQAAQADFDRGAQRLLLHGRSRHRRADRLVEVRDDDQLGEGDSEERSRPSRIPAKEATVPGSLVSPVEGGVVNWPPPAFSPETGLFYVHERNGFNILYLTETDPRGSMGLAGKAVGQVGAWPSALRAIDYKTGKPVWRHEFPGVTGAGGSGGIAGDRGQAGVHR